MLLSSYSGTETFFSKLSRIPYILVFLITIVCIYNFFILYSAAGMNIHPWCYRQIIFFLSFFPVMLIVATLDLRTIFASSYIFYCMVILLLIFVEISGYNAMGATRWINFGLIRIQPAELAKISVVMMIARYFHNVSFNGLGKIHIVILPLIGTIIPFLMIAKQPDLTTALVLFLVSGTMFFVAGIRLWKFAFCILLGLVAMPILWNFLYDYQKKRVLNFLNPTNDLLSSGYNIMQSKIAIGSGGIFGKGFGQGTQSKLNFLPEHQTDFIFATLVEELGFVGGFALCFLYLLIIYCSFSIAMNARNIYGRLLVMGIISIFFLHILINISMVMGMLPAAGIPLPFMSYGGTMMASTLIGFGLIMNVHVNNKIYLSRNI